MTLQRISVSGLPAALSCAALALASTACDPPDDAAGREEIAVRAQPSPAPAPEEPEPPEPEEDDGDAEFPPAQPEGATLTPACFHDDWHYNGHCLAKCRGDEEFTTVSKKREINYKWCFVRAWKWCDLHGKKLHSFCWGVKDENWGHDWDADCEEEEKI